ncbi:rhoptry protein [Reticulomyxa filosa]|uniref:Rhoptry protein n=1 Tax=Reticulomyxa filosa TaxID=46433 RepID=X6MRB6_RETFI|nr:rhoptry protein [Reticulomyxa filosa]|eukprot:ETO16548.1 rhoptry protein [Reticulomyxa filosa]
MQEKLLKEIPMRTLKGKIKDEVTKMKMFFSKHDIRNADETTKIFVKFGITVNDLLDLSEHDMKYQAKIEPKTIPAISQVVVLHSNNQNRMDKIYEEIKKISTMIVNLQLEVVNLENIYNFAKKILQIRANPLLYLLKKVNNTYYKIENYKKEKRELLEQKLLLFQSIEQEQLQDDNNCTLDFDCNERKINMNVQFTNKKDVENDVKIKDSKSHVNPIVSLSYSIESIKNELKERWETFKKIPGQCTIEIGEEKEHLLEWDTTYSIKMRLSQSILLNLFIVFVIVKVKFKVLKLFKKSVTEII